MRFLTTLSAVMICLFCMSPAHAQDKVDEEINQKSNPQIIQEQANGVFLGSRVSTILSGQFERPERALEEYDDIQTTQATGVTDLEGFSGPGWFSLGVRQSSLEGSDLDVGMFTVGGDLFSGPNGLFGIMLQIDMAEQEGQNDTEFDSRGYMAGIYGITELGGVTIDARLSAGETRNNISNPTDQIDDVKGERWLAAVQMLSAQELSNGFVLVPNGGVSWFEDRVDEYVIGTTPADEETIEYGQANVGARLFMPVTFGGTQGDVMFGATSIYGFGSSAGDQVPGDLRSRFDLGLELYQLDVWQVSAGVFVDGLGQEEYDALGVDVGLTLWF